MVTPEERALVDVSAHLTKSLRYCAAELAGLLFAAKLIPLDLYEKVSADCKTGGEVTMCLIARVKSSPKEFVKVVKILEEVSSLEVICQKLRESYNNHGGTQQLPLPPQPPQPQPPPPKLQTASESRASSAASDRPPPSLSQPLLTSESLASSPGPSGEGDKATEGSGDEATESHASSAASNHCTSPSQQLLSRSGIFWSVVVVCFAVVVGLSVVKVVNHPQNPDNDLSKTAEKNGVPGCVRLKSTSEDRRSLTNYFSQACKSLDETETLCKDYLKLKNCNDLQRDSKLKPFYLAESYLEQNPKACWEDIVRVFCELSKDRLANEVVEQYELNIKDCSEQI